MPFRLHFGWSLAAILAVALVLRLAAGMWWEQRLPAGKKFAFGDSESYWELGRAIGRGQPYEYGPDRLKIFRTPGFPAVLATLFWLADEPPVIWGRALAAILSTAAVGFTAALARLLFDERAGLIAGAIAAVYPESIALGVFVLSEAGFAPLMMLSLVCWSIGWQAAQERSGEKAASVRWLFWSLAAGVSAALATLMRPSWLLFVPFAGVAIAACRARPPWRSSSLLKDCLTTGLVFVGLCLTMLPWWIRNYAVAGRFVPTTLQVGASLYDGISPTASGASDMQFVGQFVAEQRAADAEANADPAGFEVRLDRRMRQAAIDWTVAHPRRVLELVGIKLLRIWSFLPNANEFQNRWLRLALLISYTPVIALAVIGAWRFSSRGWPFVLCWLPALYLTCLHVIFVSSIRYRQPAMLPLIVLAAGVITECLSRRVGQACGASAGPPIHP